MSRGIRSLSCALCAVGFAFVLSSCGAATVASDQSVADLGGDSAEQALTGPRYRVKLDRRLAVGERYTLLVDASQATLARGFGNGRLVHETREEMRTHLEGVYEVLEINPKGLGTLIAVDVTAFTRNDGQGDRHLVPPGARLLVAGERVSVGQIDVAASPEVTEALNEMLDFTPLSTIDAADFGTNVPQAVGGSWAASEAFSRSFNDPSAPRGRVTLHGVSTIDGTECLDVRADIRLFPTSLPDFEMPLARAEMTLLTQMYIPTDLTVNRPAQALQVTMSAASQPVVEDGVRVEVQIELRTAGRAAVHKL